MVELVMIMVILGALAVVAVPRFFAREAFDERGFFDESLAAARYAQRLAVATGCDVQVSFGPVGYALNSRAGGCTSGAFTAPVPHPSRPGQFSGSPPAGVVVGPAATWYFDKIGRPRDGAGVLLPVPAIVSVGGLTLVVEPETGYVHEP